ncbi:MAG: RNA polymerase sigma factor [Kiritimatiellae bacterium]|nr:RNA polymerase sigma factor [Kiritimatiellia bacterium]
MDDRDLMLCAAAGDDGAFGILVEKYAKSLLNFFLRKNVSYHDGQDLVERTFLRLWKYRARYTPQAKFTTFLFLVASQVGVDFFRETDRRARLARGISNEAEIAEASPVRTIEPGMAGDVRAAVAQLPPAMRDVVELAVFQELQYAEVAEILGIPVGTVKSRMFNALRKLKELLK